MNECPITPYDEVYRFLEREYKDISLDPKDIFEKIDPNPIGSASIAQVHKAKINDNGTIKDVAIKILRPDIKKYLILMMSYPNFVSIAIRFKSNQIT